MIAILVWGWKNNYYSWTISAGKKELKTLFNIVEERFKKLLNLDVCVVHV